MIPLWTLVGVELRKMTDTRAGVWLLGIIGALAAGVVALIQFVGEPADRTLTGLLGPSILPVAVLLPVLGILSVTSEWSQRTALTTYALIPQLGRVAVAKILAGLLLAIGSFGVCLAASAIGNLFSGGSWTVSLAHLATVCLFAVINLALGVAFGMAFMNSALSIVLYFVLPIGWSTLGALVTALRAPAAWLDLSVTSGKLVELSITPGDWARLGTSAALWIALPLALGFVRLARRDIT
jgi:ABC-2 type transport system permease protein